MSEQARLKGVLPGRNAALGRLQGLVGKLHRTSVDPDRPESVADSLSAPVDSEANPRHPDVARSEHPAASDTAAGPTDSETLRLRGMPYCLGRVGRWASRNIVAAAAFLTVYGWIYTYSYIWGFYDRFDADPEQLGFGRAEETARALAIGFPLGLAWAFVVLFGAFTACAALIWLVIGGISVYRVVAHKHPIIPDPPTSSATLWRRRWISIGNHTATQSLTFLATFIIVMYAIFTPLSNYRSGEADADHMLASKRLDIAPSIMQQITGTRAQAVVLTWISPLQSPIRDAASNSACGVQWR